MDKRERWISERIALLIVVGIVIYIGLIVWDEMDKAMAYCVENGGNWTPVSSDYCYDTSFILFPRGQCYHCDLFPLEKAFP